MKSFPPPRIPSLHYYQTTTIASTESSIVVGTEPETTWLPAQGNT